MLKRIAFISTLVALLWLSFLPPAQGNAEAASVCVRVLTPLGLPRICLPLLQRFCRTPRLGLWIDSSDKTPDQTVDEIMHRVWDEGRVD